MNDMIDPITSALCGATSTLEAAASILTQLAALFRAIEATAAADENGSDIAVQELAGLGRYVAQDFANTADLQREVGQDLIDARKRLPA